MNSEVSNAAARSTGYSARITATIARGSGCLAFVALLSWMAGSAGHDAAPASEAPAARGSQTSSVFVGRASDHRKQIFDERRARYDEAWHAKAQAERSASVAFNRAGRTSSDERR
jgi:hypothetical protein